MGEKHEEMKDPNLFYCFVNIGEDTKQFRFYMVPSRVVADYVNIQHVLWLDEMESHSRGNSMRMFRIGMKSERYSIPHANHRGVGRQLGVQELRDSQRQHPQGLIRRLL
jgi:hypothetical protein